MKKISLNIIFLICLPLVIISQNWSEPVNVSNMGGFNQMPDFCIDSNGIIHCVWIHVYDPNYGKIFYNKSFDDGLTWTTAQDISQNDEKRIANPHIAYDSDNNLHLTYDYDIGNYLETLVYYKKYNGTGWSDPVIISENLPESHANKLVIDNNDRIYCFWFRSINNGTTYYKYLENGIWSDTYIPYNNNDFHTFSSCAVDSVNNLHWIGAHHYENQGTDDVRPIYFKYNYNSNSWSNFTEISQNRTSNYYDIDLDNTGLPHCVWKEYINDSLPPDYGTFYSYITSSNWTEPELIVENSNEQQIIVDKKNKPNIFDKEEFSEGYQIKFYYCYNGLWQSSVIDETSNTFFNLKSISKNNKIYALYTKSIMIEEGEIYTSNMNIITNLRKNLVSPYNFVIYPNPSKNTVFIALDCFLKSKIRITIHSIDGSQILTLIDKDLQVAGYEFIWNGKDQNGKEVNPGLYLIRLISGRNIQTRRVIYMK